MQVFNNPSGEANRFCARCGAGLEFDSLFCSECGLPVNAPTDVSDIPGMPSFPGNVPPPAPVQPGIPAPAEPAPVVSLREKICPDCGTSIEEDSNFCWNCGHVFETILNHCSKCGAILPDGSFACGICGQPVGGAVPPVDTGIAAIEKAPKPAAPHKPAEPEIIDGISYEQIEAANRNFHRPPSL